MNARANVQKVLVTLSDILAVVTLQTFYQGKFDLLAVYQGKLDF